MRPPRAARRTLSTVAGIALAAVLGCAFPCHARDPSPLRRDDAVSGRDYELTDRTFINRFTFRHRPGRDQAWSRDPSGFRATAGSLRSSELLVDMELRTLQPIDEVFDIEIRYRHDEDFDGRYHRAVTGMGWRGGESWRIAVLGEILPEKEDIDIYAEWTWLPSDATRLRLAGVAVDATYDRKSEEGRYDQDPFTWFMELHHRPDERTQLDAWVNWNPESRLDLEAEDLQFRFRQLEAGGSVDRGIAGPWFASLGIEVGRTRKHWERGRATAAAGAEDLTRWTHSLGAEIRRDPTDRAGMWLGIRHVLLDEQFRGDDPGDSLTRRESTVHAGLLIPLASGRVLFWPGLYLNRLSTDDPRYPWVVPDGTRRHVRQVKMAFPLEIAFPSGATLTLNATVFPTVPRNGGGNVQVVVPF